MASGEAEEMATCVLCDQSHAGDVLYGEMCEKDDVRVHQFCLLFSTTLYADQAKATQESVENSLDLYNLDVLKQYVEKTSKQKCMFCEATHATIKCHIRGCNRKFHFKCGFDSERCLFKFDNLFYAFCPVHTVRSKNRPLESDTCIICMMEIGDVTLCGQISLDCRPHLWMHRNCAIRLADTRGYAFQCPVCQERTKFQKYVCLRGVFIPQRDTLTQAHNVAVQETQTKYCEAEVCLKSTNLKEARAPDKLIAEGVESLKCGFCGKVFHKKCGLKQGTMREEVGAEEINFTCSSCMTLSENELSVSSESENDLNVAFDYGSDGSAVTVVSSLDKNNDKENGKRDLEEKEEEEGEEILAKRYKFDHHYEWQPCTGYHNKEWREFKLNLFMNTLRTRKKNE